MKSDLTSALKVGILYFLCYIHGKFEKAEIDWFYVIISKWRD